jgi:hypothetical protein
MLRKDFSPEHFAYPRANDSANYAPRKSLSPAESFFCYLWGLFLELVLRMEVHLAVKKDFTKVSLIRLKPKHGHDFASPGPYKQEIAGSPVVYAHTLIDAPIETQFLHDLIETRFGDGH